MTYAINPNRDVPWNGLPPLPPGEEYYRTIPITEKLVGARIALASLKEQCENLPNPGIMVSTISLQEAKESSAIENIFTTNDELYRAFTDQQKVTGPAKEVMNYREAIFQGFQTLQNRPFNKELIIDIYQTIKDESDGVRANEVHIAGFNSVTQERTRIYTPPLGKFIIEEKLDQLIEFLLDDEKYPVDPIIKMIMGHAQFESIHPFKDGNGRTGRALNVLFLTTKQVLHDPILYLSRRINRTRDDYYKYLANVTRAGDWASWINYMLDVVRMTAYDTYDKVAEINKSMQLLLHSEVVTQIKKPHLIVEKIFTQPFTTVKHISKQDNPDGIYSNVTARHYLDILTKATVLKKISISGNHYYKNVKLTEILEQ